MGIYIGIYSKNLKAFLRNELLQFNSLINLRQKVGWLKYRENYFCLGYFAKII